MAVLVLLATSVAMGIAITGIAASAAASGRSALARVAALHLAEAGIHYQRWRIAHHPHDAIDTPGPRVLPLSDATARASGTVTIQPNGPDDCTGRITITASATASPNPRISRSVETTYGSPSFAEYAFLTDQTLYFGGGGTIDGRIHANSGIRMDANQNTVATSAVATYTCGAGHGCASSGEERPGIWGSGGGERSGLWRFPVPAVDFDAVSLDLAALRTYAQAHATYIPPSDAYGYYLNFKSNGTVDIHHVERLRNPVWSYDGTRWSYEAHDISGVPRVDQTRTIPQDACGSGNLIFVEDDVWVDGVVKGRATVVAARFPEVPDTHADVFLNGSLTLSDREVDAAAIIAQGNVRFPLIIPDTVEIDGVLIAQLGRIFRPYYPSSYSPWYIRSSIAFRGSLISNGIAVTAWVDRYGNVLSGFRTGTNTFDARYTFDPPPFVPTRAEPIFLQWTER